MVLDDQEQGLKSPSLDTKTTITSILTTTYMKLEMESMPKKKVMPEEMEHKHKVNTEFEIKFYKIYL